MPAENTHLLIQTVRHFNRYYTNLLGLLNRYRFDSPYSLAEARVILEIGSIQECTPSRLKETLKIDFGYLSRIIKRLLRDKVIYETKSATDGRSRYLFLTGKGQEILSYVNEMSDRQVETFIHKLSREELTQLAEHMQAIEKILSSVDN
jgi:DNA-binding MarR family transcriptional regulator